MSSKRRDYHKDERFPITSGPKGTIFSLDSPVISDPWIPPHCTMRVRVKDGFLDDTPYNAAGDVLDMSGFTGMCVPEVYAEAAENDGILVVFDSQTRDRIPEEYVKYSENADEFPFMYYYFRSDLERID